MTCNCWASEIADIIAPDGAVILLDCNEYSHQAEFDVGDFEVTVLGDTVIIARDHEPHAQLWLGDAGMTDEMAKNVIATITKGTP